MMYSLDVYIRTGNAGIKTAVKALLPDKTDQRVNVYEYHLSEGMDEYEVEILSAAIRFDLRSDRDGILNSIKGIAGVIHACEDGSYVRPHLCHGDDESCTVEDGGVYK